MMDSIALTAGTEVGVDQTGAQDGSVSIGIGRVVQYNLLPQSY